MPLLLAQINPLPAPQQEVFQPQEVRALPGRLDSTLVFNSNSPEVVQTEGILLSTFPRINKRVPAAHLNKPLQGRFDLFAHHIAKAQSPTDLKTLYLGILLSNPTQKPVTVDILQAASYLSQPDAPFIELPPYLDNPTSSVYAGPGDRVMNDLLRDQRQPGWPAQVIIPPRQSRMLMNLPIPVRSLEPPINGRSTLIRVRTNGPVYAASLARFAPLNLDKSERAPTLEEWQALLQNGALAGPRDKVPTPPTITKKVSYGRVAGIAQGSEWQALLSDSPNSQLSLSIPQPGQAISYVLSTVLAGTFGTGQVQSAPMLARYPDTAYQAHGNYGIKYNLSLPLYNASEQPRAVSVAMQTALKADKPEAGLRYLNPPAQQVFFRGTVRVRYTDDQKLPRTRYVHLVQRRGQQSEPLVTLSLPPQARRLVQVEFLYPPDATPPQVLTIRTLK
ncbi:MAG TPA: DUF3370 domain-containing protein [Candidatus Caenarcaniphilales bacterium]